MPRISQLPALTTSDNADEIAIVDVSASTTKKITRGDLLKAPLPDNSVSTAAISDNAVTTGKINNSAVTTDKINNSAVTIGKVNFTPQTYSNSGSGSGGGTGRYINFGGFKVCWGVTNTAISTQNAGSMSITLPSGFFSNLDSVHIEKFEPSNDSFSVSIQGSSTTDNLSLYRSAVGVASTSRFSWLVYGR